jgi:hypothetical protein
VNRQRRVSGKGAFTKAAIALAGVLALAAGIEAQYGGGAKPEKFPADYRTWTHVKSMVIHDPAHPLHGDFGGIHHVYVNKKGLATLRRGGSTPDYPDGTVFVFDLLEASLEDGAYVEGQRKAVAVMTKGAKRYAETGGWQFAVFPGGDPTKGASGEATRSCFACHDTQASKSDYIFSQWRQ